MERTYGLVNQLRDIRYVTFAADSFKDNVKVTEKEISDFYVANAKTQFMSPEKVQVEYVVFNRGTTQKTIEVSDKEIKDYYDQSIDSFTSAPEWKVAHIVLDTKKHDKIFLVST